MLHLKSAARFKPLFSVVLKKPTAFHANCIKVTKVFFFKNRVNNYLIEENIGF